MTTDRNWYPPTDLPGGQCCAVDENGDECAAFYWNGKWYVCSNVASPSNEFTPRMWCKLPTQPPTDTIFGGESSP